MKRWTRHWELLPAGLVILSGLLAASWYSLQDYSPPPVVPEELRAERRPNLEVAAESAETLLVRGPVVQRVTSRSASILGKPAPGLQNAEFTVTVTPEGEKPRSAACRYDRERDTFAARFEDLPPKTICRYEVSAQGGKAGPFHFVTAPEDSDAGFRFAVYGDSCDSRSMHQRIAQAVLATGPAFVLHAGDLVNHGGRRELWDSQFFGPARELAARVPILPCYGNHEQRSEYLTQLFDLPGDGRNYVYDYGDLRIIVLDIYGMKSSPQEPGYAWLEGVLKQKWPGWLVCLFHEPPFRSRARPPNATALSTLVPLLERHGVHLVFCGHEHVYARTKPIAGQAGRWGVVYITTGGGGQRLHRDVVPREFLAVQRAAHHYLVVDVTTGRLTVRAATPDGEVLDRFALDKDAATPDTLLRSTIRQEAPADAADPDY
jgi:predicted phosphodiesterase